MLRRVAEVQGAGRGIWLRQLPLGLAALAVAGVSAAAAWLAGWSDPRKHAGVIALWTVACVVAFWLARRVGWDLPWGLLAGPAVAPLWVALWEEVSLRRSASTAELAGRSGAEVLSGAVQRLLPEHAVLVVERAVGSSIQIPASRSGEGRMPLPQAIALVAASPDREQFRVRQRGSKVATLTVSGRPLRAAELEAVHQLLQAVEAVGASDPVSDPLAASGGTLRLEGGLIRERVERLRHRLARLPRPQAGPEGRALI